jgi:hypothetical protein
MTKQERADLERKLTTVEELLVTLEVELPPRDAAIAALETMRDETTLRLARPD